MCIPEKIIFLLLISNLLLSEGKCQNHDRVLTYKSVDSIELRFHFYLPEYESEEPTPAIVFFFGGGWQRGNPEQFEPHCRFLARLGIVGITADYRVKNRHQSTPQDAVMDARSAMRWLKSMAGSLNIDSTRIIAAGGSAGGHLAAATATLDSLDDPQDDQDVDPMPAALILFNPVLEITTFMDRFGGPEEAKKASPMFYIDSDVPPTLIFHGTKDEVVPPESILKFQEKMQGSGNYCEVHLFGGYGHAFFNKGRDKDRPYRQTLELMRLFLEDQGFLTSEQEP